MSTSRSNLVWMVLFLWAAWQPAFASMARAESDWIPDRRKDQFPSDPIYVVLPLPYSLPGIGSGLLLTLYEANYGFYHRAYAIVIGGEVEGRIFGIEQADLFRKHLLLDAYSLQVDKVLVNNYTLRGMTTGKNDFNLLQAKYEFNSLRLTYSGWERRIQAWAEGDQAESRVSRVRDHTGAVIAEFAQPLRNYQTTGSFGAQLDLTDDFVDPRKGARLSTQAFDYPRQDESQPEFYVVTTQVSGYVPVGRISTLVLTALQSDAHVSKAGLTDVNALNQRDNLGCVPGNATCLAGQAALVNSDLAANSNGTAQPLGGENYMRAYPMSRFQGAHTLYYAAELRANLTEEFTPFNYLFIKGDRTGIQIAPFYEAGSVSETPGSLGAHWRYDYGVGLRVITSAGAVYRLDLAIGDEGPATTIIFNYPW